MRLVFVVNDPAFFISHRLALAQAAARAGYDIIVISSRGHASAKIRAAGFTWHPIRLDAGGMRPWRDFATFIDLLRLFLRLRPDVVHNVTIKPILYGTFAARLARVPHVVNAISGLGFLFTGERKLRRLLGTILYRVLMRHPKMHVIVQNTEDRTFFVTRKLAPSRSVVLVRGSGVDAELFRPKQQLPLHKIVIQTSRIVADKGVREFIAAARLVVSKRSDVRFQLAGDLYPSNPSTIPETELQNAVREGIIEWLGHRDDVAELLSHASVYCLPSYREGLPKALLEAAAVGLPIVATNIAGCREVICDGVNGLLVPVGDATALAGAIETILNDDELATRLGVAARKKVESEFTMERIVTQQIALYGGQTVKRQTAGGRIVAMISPQPERPKTRP